MKMSRPKSNNSRNRSQVITPHSSLLGSNPSHTQHTALIVMLPSVITACPIKKLYTPQPAANPAHIAAKFTKNSATVA